MDFVLPDYTPPTVNPIYNSVEEPEGGQW